MRLVTSSLFVLALSGSCSADDNDTGDVSSDATANSFTDATTGPDAMPSQLTDAMPSATSLPSWMLKDIQPLSPRFGETYGMNAIEDKILVAVLVQGF